MEGNLGFKIDWASLIVGSKLTVFALFQFVFEGNFQVQALGGTYIQRGDLMEGFLCYEFEGLVHGGAYFRNVMVCPQSEFQKPVVSYIEEEAMQSCQCLLLYLGFSLSLSLSQFQLIFVSFVAISAVICHCFKAMSLVGIYLNKALQQPSWFPMHQVQCGDEYQIQLEVGDGLEGGKTNSSLLLHPQLLI